MAVKVLNQENFEEVITNSDIPVIVDFYADWCQPCKRIAPLLEEIAAEHSDMLVCKVNVDNNNQLAAVYQVMSIPNVISFKAGVPYKRAVGVVSKAELLDLVK